MGWNLYCHRCYGRISGSYFNTTLGHHFHKQCFKCDACCTALQDHGFYIIDEGYYCPRDFERVRKNQKDGFHGNGNDDEDVRGKSIKFRPFYGLVDVRNTEDKMKNQSESMSMMTRGQSTRNRRYYTRTTSVIYDIIAFCI